MVNSVESLKTLIRVNVLRVSDALDAILRSCGAARAGTTGSYKLLQCVWQAEHTLCALAFLQ